MFFPLTSLLQHPWCNQYILCVFKNLSFNPNSRISLCCEVKNISEILHLTWLTISVVKHRNRTAWLFLVPSLRTIAGPWTQSVPKLDIGFWTMYLWFVLDRTWLLCAYFPCDNGFIYRKMNEGMSIDRLLWFHSNPIHFSN